MKTKIAAMMIFGTALSGCLEADQTASGFKTPIAEGVMSGNSNSNVAFGGDGSPVTGNAYSYQAGGIKDEGFQAYSGIVPGADVSAPPTTGTATMTGRYEVAVVEGIFTTGETVNGLGGTRSGSLTLEANFANGTLVGSGGQLSVDGTFSGTTLSGTATYDGLSGPLRGLVGSDEAIGVFHGNSDSAVHAGGFIVN